MEIGTENNKRNIRICYWDSEKRYFGAHKAAFENQMQILGEIQTVKISSLEDPKFFPCDLLVVSAEHVPEDEFLKWLTGIETRIMSQDKIWTPALILADIEFSTLHQLLPFASKSNWYFDIVHPQHLLSMPIRIANLLRIHDHLHELKRYDDKLNAMQNKIVEIENLMRSITDSSKKDIS